MVRIEEEVWAAYGELCAEEGTSRADDIRRHVFSRVAAWQKAQGKPAAKRKVVVRRKKPAADSD